MILADPCRCEAARGKQKACIGSSSAASGSKSPRPRSPTRNWSRASTPGSTCENARRAASRRDAAAEIRHRVHRLCLRREEAPCAGAGRHSRPGAHGAAHSAARRRRALGRWPSSAWRRRGARSIMPGCEAADIDMVICAASHHQRPYPAIAIEIQNALGAKGAAFDMGLGCSSAAAGAACRLQSGADRRAAARAGRDARDHHRASQFPRPADAFHLRRRLDRDGRGALEEGETRPGRFEVVDTRSWTQFSNNIRTNFGFLLRAGQDDTSVDRHGRQHDQAGRQQGVQGSDGRRPPLHRRFPRRARA